MNIKHEPILDTKKIVEHYSKKDGVPVKYVCTSALDGEAQAMDIFFRETPHPEFGNKYFGLFMDKIAGHLMITNADKIENSDFGMIQDSEGVWHYSAHRHDYKEIEGKVIDGGRAYIRSNGNASIYKIKDGDFVFYV
jgi:hypothetical protein